MFSAVRAIILHNVSSALTCPRYTQPCLRAEVTDLKFKIRPRLAGTSNELNALKFMLLVLFS